MKSIMWLKEMGKEDVSVTGGKGAQLGELLKAKFNVPEGFVITTIVYEGTVKKAGLLKIISKILSDVHLENTDELERASDKIQSLISSTDLSKDAGNAILEAYKNLGGFVAVRSSATAEDQKGASFAGQMATFLNVKEDSLIDSVKKCMASLFTARAIYYRAQKKIDGTGVNMAVVVQKMVDAKKAGVAFSVNPVNNNEKEMIIEAASGLGEAVVGGQTTPDSYILDKDSLNTKVSHIRGQSSVLTEDDIRLVASAVKRIEGYYKLPQDIEWAIDGKSRLYILQARPITTLKAEQKPIWKKILAREYGVQYSELSIKCLSPSNKHIVPYSFYEQAYIPEDGNEACYIDEGKWNNFVSALKVKYVENLDNYEGFEEMFMKSGSEYMETAKTIANKNLKEKSSSQLKEMYLAYLQKNQTYGPFIWMQFIINNFFAEKAKEIVTGKVGNDSKHIFDYVGVALKPEKKAASIQLNEIASNWESLSEAKRAEAYENFKWVPCLDIHNKPWTKEEFFSHIGEFKKMENKSPMTYEILIEEIKPTNDEKRVLAIAKRLSYLKDLKDDFRRQGILYGQKLFEEIAIRMGLGLQDVSYITEEEIIGFLDYGKTVSKDVIAERKKGFAVYFNRERKIECKSGKGIKAALDELGIVVFEDFSEEIKGASASPGRAKGIVTIVKGVADLNRVKKGDILVAVTTHPDYVPAMQRAAAIVTDEGGITSHAAIISRELGLPCVVGTKYATKSLKDGDKIEIDGMMGIVRKIKR